MDALDAIIATFSDKNEYPSITNITLVGHGGGGQLIARYAAVGADAPEGVHLRYIIGDPSTNAYFTKDRPVENHSGDPSCDFWNTWRYGYECVSPLPCSVSVVLTFLFPLPETSTAPEQTETRPALTTLPNISTETLSSSSQATTPYPTATNTAQPSCKVVLLVETATSPGGPTSTP